MKIFVRSPNWIGDCVMSLPAIRALKESIPESDIIIIAKANLSSIFKNIPEISGIVELPHGKTLRSFFLLIQKLRKFRIRKGILLTNSFQSALAMRLAGIRDLTGYSKDLRGWMLSKKVKFNGKNLHQIKSYLKLIELFADKGLGNIPSNKLVFSSDEQKKAREILEKHGFTSNTTLIGISPSAAYGSAKEWPVDRFIGLIQAVSDKIAESGFVLFGSEKDEEKIKNIADSVSAPVARITGKYTLREAMTIISMCDAFAGNDSGLLHVADGAGVPAVGIFGPTSPGISSPPSEITRTVYKKVKCSPCSYRECPIDHKCMTRVTVSEIESLITALLVR